jgi:hypothetical protein
MTRVLEETTNQQIDRAHIERRVDDWLDRVETLYEQIQEWLPAGWTANKKGAVRMHEELMQKFGVAPRNVPVLQLFHQGVPSTRIEPRGLWIIGANGRLDLVRENKHYVIIDAAENLTKPDWRIAPLSDRRNLQKFTPQTLSAAL